MPHKQVVIIGGGFGGLTAAQSLRDADVLLIDRTNHHLFQPLLYQVATAALSPGDIAWPLRTIFRRHPHVRVVMDEVLSIDRAARLIRLRVGAPLAFDVLIVAPGSRHAYFGHDAWEQSAPGLKTLADALYLREKMLLAFEEAERRRVATGTQDRLTFAIVGGGPTGVELAGALAEIGRKAMGPDFPNLRLDDLAILLVEGGARILPGFSPDLSANAATALERMGVTIKLNSLVSEIRADGVMIGSEFVRSANIIWAAGNKASPLLTSLAVPQDESGRINVQRDLTIPGGLLDLCHRRRRALCRSGRESPAGPCSRRRATRPLCRETHSGGDCCGAAPAVCLRGSRHASDHRTRTSRGPDRTIAPIRAGGLAALVRGAYLLTHLVPQSRAGDVGMDVVLPHLQTRRENHLYAAAPIRRRNGNAAIALRRIRLEGMSRSPNIEGQGLESTITWQSHAGVRRFTVRCFFCLTLHAVCFPGLRLHRIGQAWYRVVVFAIGRTRSLSPHQEGSHPCLTSSYD